MSEQTPHDRPQEVRTMTLDLKPCPFCGPGQSQVGLWHDDVAKRWRVGCGRCGCSTGVSPRDKTEAPAIAVWNSRYEAAPSGQAPLEGVDWQSIVAALIDDGLPEYFMADDRGLERDEYAEWFERAFRAALLPASAEPVAWRYRPETSTAWDYRDNREVCPSNWIEQPLYASPPASAEPVAWRTRGMNCASEWVAWQMINADAAERWKRDPSFKNGRREVEPLYASPPASGAVEAGWQTMDSAPKDGTRVELWHVSDNVAAGGWPTHGSWRDWQPGIFSWRGDGGNLIKPTAWKPASAAPIETKPS